jgi:preprotein translocase subunit YajC
MLYALLLLFADAKDNADPGGGGGVGPPNMIWLILLLVAMFFVMVVLPQQRREKKQREGLLAALKKNDEVVTAAGIIGVVTSIKEGGDEVTLKIDDNARIRVLKSTIVRIVPRENKEGA